MDSLMLVFEGWNLFPRNDTELLWKLGNKKQSWLLIWVQASLSFGSLALGSLTKRSTRVGTEVSAKSQ